jgi:hypothetical protein
VQYSGHDSHSIDGDLPSTISGLLEDTDLLQGLENGPLDTGSGILVVRRPVSSSVGTSVKLGKSTNTNVLPQVDVTGDGSWIVARMIKRKSGFYSTCLFRFYDVPART